MIELKDELECPVCLKTIMDPPIFLCEKGHCLCNTCRKDIKSRGQPCPECRGALTEARNVTFGRMLDKLPKNKCKFDGCQFKKAELAIVKKHEVDCPYRNPSLSRGRSDSRDSTRVFRSRSRDSTREYRS